MNYAGSALAADDNGDQSYDDGGGWRSQSYVCGATESILINNIFNYLCGNRYEMVYFEAKITDVELPS